MLGTSTRYNKRHPSCIPQCHLNFLANWSLPIHPSSLHHFPKSWIISHQSAHWGNVSKIVTVPLCSIVPGHFHPPPSPLEHDYKYIPASLQKYLFPFKSDPLTRTGTSSLTHSKALLPTPCEWLLFSALYFQQEALASQLLSVFRTNSSVETPLQWVLTSIHKIGNHHPLPAPTIQFRCHPIFKNVIQMLLLELISPKAIDNEDPCYIFQHCMTLWHWTWPPSLMKHMPVFSWTKTISRPLRQ